MSVFAAITREASDAALQDRPVVQVRVTTDAIAGSVALAPITPERARTLGALMALPDGTIEAAYDGRAMEILVHPADWADLLRETAPLIGSVSPGEYVVAPSGTTGRVEHVAGIPVAR